MYSESRIDGFRVAYERRGRPDRPALLLLHGWPGDRADYRLVAEQLGDAFDIIVPDLRGFGESDKHNVDPAEHYGPAGQARSLLGLVDELGIGDLILGGYDVGSRCAQHLSRARPDLVRGTVIGPPAPGIAERILAPEPIAEFWYQPFHQLDLIESLIDGKPDAVAAYLTHIWTRWSGPDFGAVAERVAELAPRYSDPGAFVASINWYRAGGGSVALAIAEAKSGPGERSTTPTTFVWPDHDPLFPRAWSDRIDDYFTDATLVQAGAVGHFLPLEATAVFCDALLELKEKLLLASEVR